MEDRKWAGGARLGGVCTDPAEESRRRRPRAHRNVAAFMDGVRYPNMKVALRAGLDQLLNQLELQFRKAHGEEYRT